MAIAVCLESCGHPAPKQYDDSFVMGGSSFGKPRPDKPLCNLCVSELLWAVAQHCPYRNFNKLLEYDSYSINWVVANHLAIVLLWISLAHVTAKHKRQIRFRK